MIRKNNIQQIEWKFADPGVVEDIPELKFRLEESRSEKIKSQTISGTENLISAGATGSKPKERE
ncbi:hypothetical protein [Caloranaerobacter ferrireducens]|uniref:hypothetical protein n=1 Tax=Caloranaerobacter ferrireducens TaxID=1323370 RepID=UPI00084D1AF0|nr:hypothetical protein [Caloranaerobacter ferrireducens]